MALKYSVSNPNETWINSNGFILFYFFAILVVHLVLLSFPFLSTESVWTLTNTVHSLVNFLLLHWYKGAPFVTMDQESDSKTQWEQLTANNELDIYKRFLIAAPIIVFFIAVAYTHYNSVHFLINLAFLALAVIPKIPGLYGVRLFGINRY
ncbi:uncharacterized protein MONBRDRAFT_32962 [Monosiga brevicollis MX1]|uniref:Uncharacterized protein n=1 Tax=Monosiga brevicollis TaxID=81824 RepID=A9V2R9_MONBE|nr:uncharacterized protein MONBRDRAFT_32962 [Monosiga brevicollis MX1]EDQ87934.1 predicted protein [Monosiga brevicollis MX1]|eukprot:XP_001747010.1 hypothetical protein [Monosiga brevicollis MX1]